MSVKSNGSHMDGEAHLHPVIVLCLFKPRHKAPILELRSNTLFTVRERHTIKCMNFIEKHQLSKCVLQCQIEANHKQRYTVCECTKAGVLHKKIVSPCTACFRRLQGSSIDSCCINLCCYNRWQEHQRACAVPDRMLDRKTQRSPCQRPQGPVDSKHINIPE